MKLPIRLRLAIAYCAAFLVTIGALEVAVWVAVRTAVHSIVDRELEARLAGLDDYLTRHIPKYTTPQLVEALAVHPAFQPDLLLVRLAEPGLQTIFAGQFLADARIPQISSSKPVLTDYASPMHALRMIRAVRRYEGRKYELALATNLLIPSVMLKRLWLLLVLSIPIVLFIASAAGYWLSARAMAPVVQIIGAAQQIDSTRLDQRISVPATGDEIEQLAMTMNGMLGRIEDGFRHIQAFTANASHELRTPVAIIQSAAEVALLRTRTDRADRQALERILRGAERTTKLLEDMLHLSRLDSGAAGTEGSRTIVDLGESLRDACMQILPLSESRGITLNVDAASQCCMCANAAELRQLWLILLDNAVKYNRPNGAVSVLLEDREKEMVCRFSDSGIGIQSEHLPRVFERFYRADPARSRSTGGAGLGLSIAREIARIHQATIRVTSEPGIGSTFSVAFPASLRLPRPDQTAAERSAAAPAAAL
jgi:heavy metal sensor kinase